MTFDDKTQNEEEEIIEELVIQLDVDMDKLTIDDLEMLSKMSEGGGAVAGWEMIAFMKRVAGDEIGKLPSSQIENVMKAIASQISEEQNPKDSQGKN